MGVLREESFVSILDIIRGLMLVGEGAFTRLHEKISEVVRVSPTSVHTNFILGVSGESLG